MKIEGNDFRGGDRSFHDFIDKAGFLKKATFVSSNIKKLKDIFGDPTSEWIIPSGMKEDIPYLANMEVLGDAVWVFTRSKNIKVVVTGSIYESQDKDCRFSIHGDEESTCESFKMFIDDEMWGIYDDIRLEAFLSSL